MLTVISAWTKSLVLLLDVNVKSIDASFVVDPSVTPLVVDAIVIVGFIPSITMSLLWPNEPAVLGETSVNVASFPAASLIVPLFNANALVEA